MTTTADARPGRWQSVAVSVALFAAVTALYWPATANDFVSLDDPNYVFDNRQVLAGLSWDGVRWAFTAFHASHWHPLTWLSLMLDAELFGPGPRGFHAVNVLIHAANAALLFLALRALTGVPWASALTAALFAVHPLRVESVAWVTERKDVLSGLWFILALLAYAGYARRGGAGRYVLLVATCALGLMAKPMLVTLPAVLLLLDVWPLRRWTSGRTGARLVLEKAPLFLLSAGSMVMTVLAASSRGAMSDLQQMPFAVRAASAALAYCGYLRTAFWPTGLAAAYPHAAVISVDAAARLLWPGVAAGAALLAITGLAIAARRAWPYVFVGWFWFAGMLLPVSGLAQAGFQARADRFTYLPMIGLIIALVWVVRDAVQHRPALRPLALALGVTALTAAALATRAQLDAWRNSVTLFEHALAVTQDNYFAHANLASVLAAQGRDDDAVAHYEAALRINPRYATALAGLGSMQFRRGRLDAAAELGLRALEEEPDSPVVLTNVGAVRFRQDRLDEAAIYLERAVALAPDYAMAHGNLGAIYFRQGQVDRAAEHFARAAELNPGSASAFANLGLARMQQGRWADAVAALETALRLQPDNAAAQRNLATARARLVRSTTDEHR